MEIKSVKICKCKRFPLYGDDEVNIDFNSKVIMIEGRNGSGKTSLFSMLSPLPKDKNDFEVGGRFVIEILHHNSTYVLTSDFSGRSPKYSFNVNGEELNEDGNVTTQRTLVRLNFNITPNIFDIMYGKDLFTETNLGSRKKLFSTLTKLNIDHVLKGYNEINDEYKFNLLTLKNDTKLYKVEESKLIDGKDFDDIVEALDKTKEDIDYLLEMRSTFSRYFIPDGTESVMNDLNELVAERKQLLKDHYALVTSHSLEEVDERILTLRDKLTANRSTLEFLYRQLEELELMENRLKEQELEDVDMLKEKLILFEAEVKSNYETIELISEAYKSDASVMNSYYYLNDTTIDALKEMVPNLKEDGSYIYSKKELDTALTTQDSINLEVNQLRIEETNHLSQLHSLEHLEGQLTCPKCHNKWNAKELVNEEESKQFLSKIYEKRAKLTEKLKETENYIDHAKQYFENYRRVMSTRHQTEEKLHGFWKKIDDEKLLLTSPASVISLVTQLGVESNLVKRNSDLKSDMELIKERIQLLNSFSGDTVSGVRNKMIDVNSKIISMILSNRMIDDELQHYTKLKLIHDKYKALSVVIERTKDLTREYNLSVVCGALNNTIDELIRDLRVRSNELSSVVHNQDNIKYTMSGMERKIKDTEETIKVLDLTLKELSPKNGIIAKTISSFLNTIIINVNKTLSQIWSYKMVLLPIDLEHSDLNYKFKIEVEDTLKVDDISLASKGMKEAINLAFKLVLYKLYGFMNYPLYLDELASNMDEGHTEKMSKLISTLAYESSFSQIFIISHKENLSYLKDSQKFSLS